MPADWYYLDNGTQFGPMSGRELKQLADDREVFPWTPVKRVSGSDVSPWTRAGAIQGLFAGDVRGKLGDPICDDCGHVLKDGKCPVCSARAVEAPPPPVPPLEPPPFVVTGSPEQQEPAPVVRPRTAPISVDRKYPNLRAHVGAIKLLAWVQLLVMGFIAMFAVIRGFVDPDPIGLLGPIGGILVGAFALFIGLMIYTGLMAIAELFLVFIDTEENTRRTSAIIERLERL